MSWFIVALTAYFLLAITNLIDKFLVEKVLGSARAYTFIACIMGASVLIIAPWFLSWPGFNFFLFNIFLGFVFAAALLFLYASLRRGEASRAVVIIGGSTPVFSLPLSYLILGDNFSSSQLLAMGLLILGVTVVAFLPKLKLGFWDKVLSSLNLKQKYSSHSIFFALASGFMYALYFVGSKMAYGEQDFLSAFLWIRLGAALAVIFILLSPRARREIKSLFERKPSRKRNQSLIIGNQILGSLGFVLQNYAIYLGPVALVNALQGVQYAWIIVLGLIVSLLAPKILKEDISWRALSQKAFAILLISAGIYFLFL
ncbi:MAG: EamA family transporter [Patescibacteria group bacterium]|nr:EamA family transporter [Patescibacteria group bacterium]